MGITEDCDDSGNTYQDFCRERESYLHTLRNAEKGIQETRQAMEKMTESGQSYPPNWMAYEELRAQEARLRLERWELLAVLTDDFDSSFRDEWKGGNSF